MFVQIKTSSSSDQGLAIAKGSLNLMSLAAGTVIDFKEGFRSERASERRDQELFLSWAEKSQE